MRPQRSIQQKIVLDAVFISLAVILFVLARPSVIAPVGRDVPPVFLGFYVIYLGVLFLLSYFYSDASYVLRSLIWICEHFSHPRGRHMAFVYFGLSFVLGVCALCSAFGLIRWGR